MTYDNSQKYTSASKSYLCAIWFSTMFYVKYVIYLSKIAIIIFFSQHTETIEQLNFVSTLSDTNNSYHFRQI